MNQHLILAIINIPHLSLLEAHGSEKIVQDANELENNKNQIIETLRNYAIEIQKISATVVQRLHYMKLFLLPGFVFQG